MCVRDGELVTQDVWAAVREEVVQVGHFGYHWALRGVGSSEGDR